MISIRTLQKKDDLHELIALSKEFFEEYEAHHLEFFKVDRLRDSDIVEFFSRSIESEDSETFVAVAEGQIVGYISASIRTQPSFYRIKRVGAISGLMIHQAHRRRGIASRLFARAQAFFEEKGVRYFSVYTATANQAAIRFYEQHGMTPLLTTMVGRIDGSRPPDTSS